ncbi:hypothetical protein Hanom_Chr08g00735661 [Helianthus anomalus]
MMPSNEEVVLVLETKRNPKVWSPYDLCLMSNNTEVTRCKYYGKFLTSWQTQL